MRANGTAARSHRVIVSHPHTAFISQQTAAGLERHGGLAAYFAGMAWPDEGLPRSARERTLQRFPRSRNRLIRDVRPRHLVPVTWPEVLARAGKRARARPGRSWSWYDAMFVAHDAAVAALPWPRHVAAVYAYEDAALWTFGRAGRAGIRRFYDLPIIYYRTLERILRGEQERFPEAEPERIVSEPAWKQHRKDAELERADIAVVASQFTRESLEDAPRRPSRIEVVPYGFPVDLFRSRTEPPKGPFTVLSVGTQDIRKGTPYLLEAWKRAGLKDARLRLIGNLRLSERFVRPYEGLFEHLPGLPRTQLEAEFHAADLMAFPTLGDGFGLVMQEAMASGTPVATTRCGGGPECIENGKTGFLLPERDVDALTECLVHAYHHREEMFEMGQAARQRAEAWTPEDAGEATARLVLSGA